MRGSIKESEWIQPALEHIKVFIQTPLGVAATTVLSKQLVDFFLAWVKEQRSRRPEQDQKKLTIYGPDRKPVKIVTVKGDRINEE
jgi:hypothetical protein